MRALCRITALAIVLLAGAAAQAIPCPNVYIILDRSGSMGPGPGSNWAAAVSAINTFTSGQAKPNLPRQQTMRFGLMVFPNHSADACSVGENVVACEYYTASAINSALAGATYEPTGGSTPMGETLQASKSLTWLSGSTGRKRFVVLITDGQPTCGSGGYGDSGLYAQTMVQQLFTQGVKTFVIGFGSGVDPVLLDDMATAGGTARTGATKYYVASDTTSLNAALDAIAQVAAGEMGSQVCDDSCYANPCPDGQLCQQSFVTFGGVSMNLGKCVADPCLSVQCGADQACRGGHCIATCTGGCNLGEVCKDGACVADPGTSTCSPACDRRLICQAGRCIDDPCGTKTGGVRCPTSAPFCDSAFGGNCYAFASQEDGGGLIVDPGADGGSGSGKGSGSGVANAGCGCSSAGAASSLAAFASLALIMRRRRS